ncbi:MAG: Rhodococcus phage ReqiPoco6 [Bacteroidota bacterium]|jgi:hypothetical protein
MPSDIAIKIRRGTNAQWLAANPILAAGELGLNTDNNRLKVGNGSLGWNSLSYINISPGDVNEATQDYIGAFLQNGTHDGINVTYNDTLNTIAISVDRDKVVDKTTAQTLTNKTIGSGSALSADFSAGNFKITNLASPSSNNDAANKSYVDTQISNIIDAAPTTLNTLNELAAAINDDASYAATITTALGNKLDSATAVSTYLSQANAASTYAPIASPTFTGTVTFPANTSGANLINIPNSALSNNSITINGSAVSLGGSTTIDALPSQSSQNGKYLTTNGTVASWAAIPVTSQAAGNTLGTVYGQTSSSYITALGRNALGAFNESSSITAIGADSLRSNTTGSQNTALGVDALYMNTTGSSNTAIGFSAIRQASATAGSNTAIGSNSLYNVTGSFNTAVGMNAGNAATSGDNNIIIGAFAEKSSVTAENEITLGSVNIRRLRVPGLGIDINKNIEIMQIMEAY